MSEEETKVIAEEKEEETADDSASMPPPPEKAVEIEKMEEQKLKSKFPGNRRVKGWGGSSIIVRWQAIVFCIQSLALKSWLYLNAGSISAIGGRPGGGGHSAFLQKRLGKGQKYFDSGDYQMAKQGGRLGRGPIPVLAQPTGEEHPTPDSVPARKSSIIQGDI